MAIDIAKQLQSDKASLIEQAITIIWEHKHIKNVQLSRCLRKDSCSR